MGLPLRRTATIRQDITQDGERGEELQEGAFSGEPRQEHLNTKDTKETKGEGPTPVHPLRWGMLGVLRDPQISGKAPESLGRGGFFRLGF